MADIRYNVSQLFKAAFGINSPVFITEPLIRSKPTELSFKGIKQLPEYYQPDATSWMGTPIMFQAKFENGSYRRYKPNGDTESIQMAEFILPPATMFSFRRAKNVNKTNVLGSTGTVKEIFGFDDWIIDVRGLAIDEPNRTAAEQIAELLKWEELADGIDVSGELFNSHNIFRVAMEDWNDNLVQGKLGVIAFSCQLTSDVTLDLINV